MSSQNQYQDAFNESLSNFKKKKPFLMAELADALWESPFLIFSYLNFSVSVNWKTGEIVPSELTTEEKIVLYQYLTDSCGVSRSRSRWVSFLDLPEGQHHYTPFVKEAMEPLASCFGNDLEGFQKIGRLLGGRPAGLGDCSWEIRVLPKISLLFIIWAGDEEFGPRANILFSGDAEFHLATATLYMLGISTVQRLINFEKDIKGNENC